MTAPRLRADGVSKRFGDVRVLDDVSLEVHPGEVLRPAGAERRREDHPDAAAARDGPPHRRHRRGPRARAGLTPPAGQRGAGAAWARIGYLVEAASAYPERTATENLAVIARLRGTGGAAARRAVDDATLVAGDLESSFLRLVGADGAR